MSLLVTMEKLKVLKHALCLRFYGLKLKIYTKKKVALNSEMRV